MNTILELFGGDRVKLLVRNLCKKYDEVTIIGNASYTFEQDRIYAVLGAAKSGKTTFLDCIGREVTPDSGSIRLDGGAVKDVDYSDFGFVTKEPLLIEYMTGREYVRYCLKLQGSGEDKIDEYFDMLGMGEDTLDMLIREYTDGEKQALQMIVIMAVDPPVILMDEPFFGSKNEKAVKRFISSMKPEHIIIMTADSLDRVRGVSDEILTINHGAVEGYTAGALEDGEILSRIEAITNESGEETNA